MILLAIAVFAVLALDCRLAVRHYTLQSDKVDAPVRLVLISDLHSCRYGKDQQNLIRAVREQQPDLVLLAGDIFDEQRDNTYAEQFLAAVGAEYACWYVPGNHEYWAGEEKFAAMMGFLEAQGVHLLAGRRETVTIRGQNINLCGVDDPSSPYSGTIKKQLQTLKQITENGHYSLVLSHRPEAMDKYVAAGFDLALCGHAHGGQVRLPGLINGLYAPNQGFFPDYAGGQYTKEGTTMIVSRGLARESTPFPRIFNRPELVVIDIE